MRELLGLSLTANTVVCTLVDPVDGTIIAEDIVEVDSAENLLGAAANSVEAFASPPERDIGAVRIAWSKGTAGSALKLTSTLKSLGFNDIDLVSADEARHGRNRTARDIDPQLELAYGAARTVVADDHNRPIRRMAARLPARRVLLAAAGSVVVLAVGTAAAGYLLVGEAPPQASDHASPLGTTRSPVDDVPMPVAPAPRAPEVVGAPPAALALPPVGAVPSSALPPPPPSAAAVASAVTAARPPVEADVGPSGISDDAAEPETAAVIYTAPAPAPAATAARQPHLTHEAPSAGPEQTSEPAPATAMVGQPHLPPGAQSGRPLPGPVPLMSLMGAPPPPAPAPPPPNPLNILSALP